MAVKVTINRKVYTVPELGFNAVCELQENGVDVMDPKSMRKNALSAARAIVAWITDSEIEDAGTLIEQHILGGGSLEEVFEAFNQAAQNSGFFSALGRKEESTTTKRKKTAATTNEE